MTGQQIGAESNAGKVKRSAILSVVLPYHNLDILLSCKYRYRCGVSDDTLSFACCSSHISLCDIWTVSRSVIHFIKEVEIGHNE